MLLDNEEEEEESTTDPHPIFNPLLDLGDNLVSKKYKKEKNHIQFISHPNTMATRAQRLGRRRRFPPIRHKRKQYGGRRINYRRQRGGRRRTRASLVNLGPLKPRPFLDLGNNPIISFDERKKKCTQQS